MILLTEDMCRQVIYPVCHFSSYYLSKIIMRRNVLSVSNLTRPVQILQHKNCENSNYEQYYKISCSFWWHWALVSLSLTLIPTTVLKHQLFFKNLWMIVLVNRQSINPTQMDLTDTSSKYKNQQFFIISKMLPKPWDVPPKRCKGLPIWSFFFIGPALIYNTESTLQIFTMKPWWLFFKNLILTKTILMGLTQWSFVPLCLTLIYTTESILQTLTTKP